ncbi:hypothetical protein KDW_29190 [Dictyobacter vulcani]|uniref:RNA polymerase sigma factor 70 region 4 type 2 domain-containing protein n=1 Tax=Dictyobacter vulcani TaxID=2607529 RepID=A0A5J4KQW7_9CHLR|nr:sigma-70 family RNA polymerase sigma factor [Dictyobacter vulcani]GER88757.1 hypothetical protein KDW_29190 [Dictyobacter vulcani]
MNVDDLYEQIYYDEELSPERLMERSEDYLNLYALVDKLPAAQQRVLRLRLVHGLRCSEIAKQLGKTEGAIRTQFARTLNVLRLAYGQKEGRDNG